MMKPYYRDYQEYLKDAKQFLIIGNDELNSYRKYLVRLTNKCNSYVLLRYRWGFPGDYWLGRVIEYFPSNYSAKAKIYFQDHDDGEIEKNYKYIGETHRAFEKILSQIEKGTFNLDKFKRQEADWVN